MSSHSNEFSSLSLYTTYQAKRFSLNKAKNPQEVKNYWKQWPGKSNFHTQQTFSTTPP